MSVKLCGYGCGREAKFPPGKGMSKWCCEDQPRKCPAVRKSYGNPGEKNPMYKRTHTQETKELIRRKAIGRKSTRKYKSVKLKSNNFKCDYGCGSIANYRFANGKNCCSEHQSSCLAVKSRIGKGVEGKMVGENHPFYGKTHTAEVKKEMGHIHKGNIYAKMTYMRFLECYPWFERYEEIKQASDGSIRVRCKECERWFQPKTERIYRRAKILDGEKWGNGYLFCSEKCKHNNDLYYKKKDPRYLEEYSRYKQTVLTYTYRSTRDNFDKIGNYKLSILDNDVELDHKYSMAEGFKNKVSPKIIGHWANLEYIKISKNRSKGQQCSISINKLLDLINNSN